MWEYSITIILNILKNSLFVTDLSKASWSAKKVYQKYTKDTIRISISNYFHKPSGTFQDYIAFLHNLIYKRNNSDLLTSSIKNYLIVNCNTKSTQ